MVKLFSRYRHLSCIMWCSITIVAWVAFNSTSAFANDLTSDELDSITSKPGLNWLRGERYDPFKGVIKHRVIDMKIPGNGTLDLLVIRDDKQILIPRLFNTGSIGRYLEETGNSGDNAQFRWHYTRHSATGGHCTGRYDKPGATGELPIVLNLYGSKIYFYSTANPAILGKSRFPADAKYVSPSNWYIACENSIFNIYDPSGKIWTFNGKKNTFSDSENSYSIYLTSIQDSFGNTIDYSYKSDSSIGESFDKNEWQRVVSSAYESYKDKPQISTISASDGRLVTFNYTSSGTLKEYFDNGYPNKRSREVTFDGSVTRWKREDGKEWYYKREHNLISEVRYPEGMILEYGMSQARRSDYIGNLNSSDPSYATSRQEYYIHSSRSLSGTSVYQQWTFSRAVDNNAHTLTRTIDTETGAESFTYHRLYKRNSYSSQYINDLYNQERAVRGKLLKSVSSKHRTLDLPSVRTKGESAESSDVEHHESVYTWEADPSFFDRTKVTNFDNRKGYFQAEKPRLKKMTTSVIGGSNALEFTREYSHFNAFHLPGTVTETNGSGKQRLTRISYISPLSEVTPWIVGLWKEKELGIAFFWEEGMSTEFRTYSTSTGALERSIVDNISTYFSYHSDGSVSRVTDDEGKWEQFDSYKRGIPTRTTTSSGAVKVTEVNTDGTIKEESTWFNTGIRWKFEYDTLRRLSKVTSPEPGRIPKTITWTTNSSNRTITRIETQGSEYKRTTHYNMLMDPISEFTEYATTLGREGITNAWEYDALGRLKKAILNQLVNLQGNGLQAGARLLDPNITTYRYDGLDRLVEESRTSHSGETDVTKYSYGIRSGARYIKRTDPAPANIGGTVTTTTYLDSFGHINNAWTTGVLRPESTATIGRDILGRMKSLQQGGITRRYNYYLGLLESEEHPETGKTDYTYYSNGNLKSKTQGGNTTTYFYDQDNRLEIVDGVGANADYFYTYYPDGSLESVFTRGNNIVSQYEYDKEGQTKLETHSVYGQSFKLKYDYNALGHLSQLTYPSSKTYNFAPDGLGRATKVAVDGNNLASNLRHYPSGLLSHGKMGSALYTEQTLTANHLPDVISSKKNGSNTLLAKHDYGYDLARNVTQIEITGDTTDLMSMNYDKQNRLTRVTSGRLGDYIYDYDAVDNIDWIKINGVQSNYNYDSSNKLTSITGGPLARSSFSYDSHGNTTWTGKNNISYNSANQITSLRNTQNSPLEHYYYDGHGRRILTELGGKEIYTIYGIDGTLRHRFEPEKDYQSDYHYNGGRLIARSDFSESGSTGPTGTGAFEQSADGVLSMEAESANAVAGDGNTWNHKTLSDASGGAAMKVEGSGYWNLDSDPTHYQKSAKLHFPIVASVSGTHTVWIRTKALDNTADSLHLSLDDQFVASYWLSNYNQWQWSSRTVSLTAGESYTLTLWAREMNVTVDKVVVLANGLAAPSGEGPAESTRQGSATGTDEGELPFIDFMAPPVNLPSKPGLFEEVKISAAGTVVKRISDFWKFSSGEMPHFNATNDANLAFGYSRHHAFSKDNTYILGGGGWRWRALWHANGAYVREVTQAGSGEAVWSNTENDYIYLVDTDTKSFSKTNVLNDSKTVLRTFPYSISMGESEGSISDDDKRVAFSSNNNGQVRVTAYDIEQDTYTEKTLSRTYSDLDWVSVSRSGNYILVAYDRGVRVVELYNWDLSFVRRITNQKHGDIGWDENGDECWFSIGHLEPDTSRTTIGKWRLSDNAYTEVLGGPGRFTNQPDSLSGHISATATDRNPGRINVSLTDPEGPYTLFSLKTDGSEKIQFFGWHGSDIQEYYDEPHFLTNRTGDVGVFKSNWGNSDDPTEMYLIYKDPDS